MSWTDAFYIKEITWTFVGIVLSKLMWLFFLLFFEAMLVEDCWCFLSFDLSYLKNMGLRYHSILCVVFIYVLYLFFPWTPFFIIIFGTFVETDCQTKCGNSATNNNFCVGTQSGDFGPASAITCECAIGYYSPTSNGLSCVQGMISGSSSSSSFVLICSRIYPNILVRTLFITGYWVILTIY
jgi:hypothetical protein